MNPVKLLFPEKYGTTSAIKQVSVNLFTFRVIVWNIKEVVICCSILWTPCIFKILLINMLKRPFRPGRPFEQVLLINSCFLFGF